MEAWPRLERLDIPSLQLLCHRPRSSSALSLSSLKHLYFPFLRPNHHPLLERILNPSSMTHLRTFKAVEDPWPTTSNRAETAALLDRIAPQLLSFGFEDLSSMYRGNQWALEPVVMRMVNLRILSISPNLVHLDQFLHEVVVSELVHLQKLAFPQKGNTDRGGTAAPTAVVHCLRHHPTLAVVHLPARIKRLWKRVDHTAVQLAAQINDVYRECRSRYIRSRCLTLHLLAVAEEWDTDDEELAD